MKNLNTFLFITFWSVLLFCSCGKGFLDVTPTDSVDGSTAIKTPSDANGIINGIMRTMTSADYYGRNFVMYGDAKGGDFTIYSQGRGLDQLYTFNHAKGSGAYGSFWSTIFNSIMQCNNLLENIEKQEAAGITGFNDSKGQALTARALMYFDLVRLYGKAYTDDKTAFGVPNVTKTLAYHEQPLRATVDQNYNQIISDLEAAAPLLSKSKNNGYLNYYGNLALQARVYLSMGNTAAALKAAEEIINSKVYTLYTPQTWVDSWSKQFGTESIFELGIFPNEGDLGNASLGMYLRKKGYGSSAAAGWFGASDYFLTRLNQDPNDVRWGIMGDDELSTPRLGSCYKYSGNISLVGGDGKNSSTALNVKVIRLSEIYLIAAEAALPTDKIKAAGYLNQIRNRAAALAPATAATISLDMILDEKSKELFAEGQRYFDMIRLNRTIEFNDEYIGAIVSHRPKTIDRSFYKTILPISQDEINASPGLEQQQNPGY